MGKVDQGLGCAFEADIAHFIEQDCRDNRDGKPEDDTQQANLDGVAEDRPEFVQSKHGLKILEPCPRALENPLHDIEVFEGDGSPVHRQVVEREIVGYRRYQ